MSDQQRLSDQRETAGSFEAAKAASLIRATLSQVPILANAVTEAIETTLSPLQERRSSYTGRSLEDIQTQMPPLPGYAQLQMLMGTRLTPPEMPPETLDPYSGRLQRGTSVHSRLSF